jgi:hypothetical protein
MFPFYNVKLMKIRSLMQMSGFPDVKTGQDLENFYLIIGKDQVFPLYRRYLRETSVQDIVSDIVKKI